MKGGTEADMLGERVVGELVEGIRKSLKFIPPERMFVDPDCGLKTRTVDEAKEQLSNIKKAVDVVRAEL